jgi:hypothetical protein
MKRLPESWLFIVDSSGARTLKRLKPYLRSGAWRELKLYRKSGFQIRTQMDDGVMRNWFG